jgi:hypothetical protein
MRTMSDGSEFHLRIIAAMDAIYKFTQLIDTSGYVLNADEATRAVTLVENFLGHYGWLREYAADQGTELFHVVLKFHMLLHLAAASKHLNPKFYWCFKQEDFVGRISKCAMSVAFGSRSTKHSFKLAVKYRYLLHFVLTRCSLLD